MAPTEPSLITYVSYENMLKYTVIGKLVLLINI